jgi:glycosyltransferase involved in cell wall biosynthesis
VEKSTNNMTIFKLYKNKVGGTENCVNVLAMLMRNKYNVRVVAAIDKKESLHIVDSALLLNCDTDGKLNHYSYFKKLKAVLKNNDSSILVSTDICTSVFIIIINIMFRLKKEVICWEHIPFNKNSLFFRLLSCLFYPFAHGVVVLSSQEKCNYPLYLKNKIHVIYNAVSLPYLEFFRKRKQVFNSEEMRLVSIGRLSAEKGLDRVIKGCIAYCKSNRNKIITLNVIGDGPLRESLEEEVSRDKIDNFNAIFHGLRFNITEILSENDIYISGSYFECLPTSVIEAQLMGVPTISFEHKYGTKEIIENGINGYLISEPEGFTTALDLLSNKDHYDKLVNASIINSERFLPEIALKKWEALINHA